MIDPGALAGAAYIVGGVAVGLLGRRGIKALDDRRDERHEQAERQQPARRTAHVPAGARR